MAARSVHHAARHCVAMAARSTATLGVQHNRATLVRSGRMVSVMQPRLASSAMLAGVWRSTQVACFSSDSASRIGPMNDDIQARVVSIVGDDGKMRRDVPIGQAMLEARSAGVDLVQVANNNGQAVCRMFNAQKRLFTLKKAMKQSKPKQDKEVTFGVKTESNDIKTKAAQLQSFLSKGHKVKVTVKFGREFHLLDKALEQLKTIEEAIGTDIGGPDHKPQNQYGGVYVHFVPKTSK